MKLILGFVIFIIFGLTCVNAQTDSLQTEKTKLTDSIEGSFQDYIDTLFTTNAYNTDTFGWDTKLINSGHFDSKDMTDTIHIPLVDSFKQPKFILPFKNYVTCGFGPRRRIFHFGMDIKLFKGDSVKAAMDGIVRVSKYDRRGYGRVLVLRHPNGLETIYGHLSKTLVELEQSVKAGEVIGLGGNSGRSTGTHLHFEMRYLGEPFDPNDFYDFQNFALKTDTLNLSRTNFEYLIELRKAKYCTIRKGDCLGKIAMRNHTSVSKLCKLNHISTRTTLRAGRKLRYQ